MKQVNFRLSDEDYKLLQENLPCSVPSYCKSVATGFVDKIKAKTGEVNVRGRENLSLLTCVTIIYQRNLLFYSLQSKSRLLFRLQNLMAGIYPEKSGIVCK